MAGRRDVAPFLQRIRDFLLGREHNSGLRFECEVAKRTQPPPKVPTGHVGITTAYYYKRNARNAVKRPVVIFDAQQKAKKKDAKIDATKIAKAIPDAKGSTTAKKADAKGKPDGKDTKDSKGKVAKPAEKPNDDECQDMEDDVKPEKPKVSKAPGKIFWWD